MKLSTIESLAWVREHMPKESAQALAQFLTINPNYRGAGWDDCLDRLLDADAHLSVTEPLYEDEDLRAMGALPAAVAITCLYASKWFAESSPDDQHRSVIATIMLNGATT